MDRQSRLAVASLASLLVGCSERSSSAPPEENLGYRMSVGPHGSRVLRSSNGSKVELRFSNDGLWRLESRVESGANGSVGKWMSWDADGKLASTGSYAAGGEWSFWDGEGKVLCTARCGTPRKVDGKRPLEYTCFDAAGTQSIEEFQARRKNECPFEGDSRLGPGDPRCPLFLTCPALGPSAGFIYPW
jgi:hypothetical protein